jgi:hypothetical protein
MLPLAVLTAPFAGALVLDIGYLSVALGFAHFSREQEMQADKGGFDRMVAAGYDASAAPEVWRERIDEQTHSTFEKVRKAPARGGTPNWEPRREENPPRDQPDQGRIAQDEKHHSPAVPIDEPGDQRRPGG